MKFLSFLCTKWMGNCEAMTSSTRLVAYSYQLVKKCFLKICETSKCHNFLIFQPIFIRFSLFYSQIFTLSYEINLNLFRISPLSTIFVTIPAPFEKVLISTLKGAQWCYYAIGNILTSKWCLKGKFPQTAMWIGWVESYFRNPIVKL